MRTRTGAALILTVALLAAGCSGSDATGDDVAATPTATTPSSGSESPSDLPSSDGQLPEGYPEDEVPLADGEIGEVLVNDAVGSYLIKVYPDTDFAGRSLKLLRYQRSPTCIAVIRTSDASEPSLSLIT